MAAATTDGLSRDGAALDGSTGYGVAAVDVSTGYGVGEWEWMGHW
jgi:hypothetical protein